MISVHSLSSMTSKENEHLLIIIFTSYLALDFFLFLFWYVVTKLERVMPMKFLVGSLHLVILGRMVMQTTL